MATTTKEEGIIEVADYNGTEDDYSSTIDTETTTLSSSIASYEYENGRRYHAFKAGKYALPNDEVEQERLDIAHHWWLLLGRGDLYKAPLENPKRALDVGTGTGVWAVEFADEHHDCEVIGTDLSPIQPGWVPPNVRFIIDDAESEWVESNLDFVHFRNLIGAISDWDALFKKAFNALNPGGYLEFHESDITTVKCDDGSADLVNGGVARVMIPLAEAGKKVGRRMDIASQLSHYMKRAGFEDIHVEIQKSPYGPWAKDPRHREIGKFLLAIAETGFEAYSLALFTRVLGFSVEDAKERFEAAKKDMRNRKIHAYNENFFVYGRKPLNC